MSRVFPALVSLSLVAACGGGGGDDAFDAPPAVLDAIDAAPILLPPPPDGEGFQVRVADTLAPGETATFCQFFPLPDGGIDVSKIEHRASPGLTVHVVVQPTASAPATLPPTLIRNCSAEVLGDAQLGAPVYARHAAEGALELPAGVALPMDPERGLSIYVEYLVENEGGAPANAELLLNVWKATGTITGEAGTFYAQSTLIAVPPAASGTSSTSCPLPAGVTLLDAQPHTNLHGTGAHATTTIGNPGPATPLFETDATMALAELDPPRATVANQYLSFTCDYTNPGDTVLIEGAVPLENERCSVIATYYVPAGTRLPFADEFCITDEAIVYAGDRTCAQQLTCTQAIDWNVESDIGEYFLCRTQACERAADAAFVTLTDCAFAECYDACDATPPGTPRVDDAGCQACLDTACPGAREACAASTCP